MSTIVDRLPTIDDLDVEGKRVLLRTDLNVPLASTSAWASASVVDDTRIRAALPTIEELLRRGARLVLVSHLDRPTGVDHALSMRTVAERLATLTGATVPLAPAVTGAEVRELTERLAPGAMLMLENVRFAAGETSNDPRLVSALAELADLYVDDAFGSAHCAHASTEGVAHLLPSAAGRLMEREVLALSAVVEQPARPLVAILGGNRFQDRFGLVRRFLGLADVVCLGGDMSLPFLAVLGHRVGRATCAGEDQEAARVVVAATAEFARLELPDQPGPDIGAETANRYAAEIGEAATVFWSGAMGRFDLPPFDAGTRAIAAAAASTSATTVVGGTETVQALRAYGLQDRVSHLSTGEAAMIEFLEGRELPGVQALRRVPLTAG